MFQSGAERGLILIFDENGDVLIEKARTRERRDLAIATALACDPDILIADEPTTALDVTIQAQILELLRRLSGELGMSILLITHDLGVVAEFADEVAVMYLGRVVEIGDRQGGFEGSRHPYTEALLSAIRGPPDCSGPVARRACARSLAASRSANRWRSSRASACLRKV